jgi:hypothetical protein
VTRARAIATVFNESRSRSKGKIKSKKKSKSKSKSWRKMIFKGRR